MNNILKTLWQTTRKASLRSVGNLAVYALVISCLAISLLYFGQQQIGQLSPQSIANLSAANSPTLSDALRGYPNSWPPVYPTALWITNHLHLQAQFFNLTCFCLLLWSIGVYSKRFTPGVHAAALVLLIGMCHPFHANIYQQVSEPLFLLFSFMIMTLLAHHHQRPRMKTTLLLGSLSAAACMTKFFGVFWLVPLSTIQLLLARSDSGMKERMTHATAYLGIVFAGVGPWLLWLKHSTGHFTGADRYRRRRLMPQIDYWNDITDIFSNIRYACKTFAIDLFSPHRLANHGVVHGAGATVTTTEILSFVLFGLLILAAAIAAGKLHKPTMLARTGTALRRLATQGNLPFRFALAYWIVLITLWTVGNNDPMYTRFLYPSYIFVILSVFGFYAQNRDEMSPKRRAPFYLLYWFFISVHVVKLFIVRDVGYVWR